MFKNLKWLRLTPDRPGRGGTKTGIHTFQQDPVNDIRSLYGGHVFRGMWRRDYDPALYPNPQTWDPGSQQPLALHGYVYPSLTDPAAKPGLTVLSQHLNLGATASHIWDFSGTLRASRPSTLTQAAVFQNVNGRCFVADGLAEGLVLDDRTPAIHAQPNQNLGIGAPQQPMPVAGVTSYGTGYCHNLSPYLNHPNPNNLISTIITTDTVTIARLNANVGYIGTLPLSAVPSANGVTSNVIPFTAPGTGISITTGTSLVTLVGGVWPANYKYAGLAINFNGYSYVILSHGVLASGGANPGLDINGNAIALSNVQLLILGVYDGPTLTNVPYTITGAQVQLGGNSTYRSASSTSPPQQSGLGYGQRTASNLVQVRVDVDQANTLKRNLGNISLGPAGKTGLKTSTGVAMGVSSPTIVDAFGGFLATDVGRQIVVETAAGTLLVTSISIFNSVNSVTLSAPNPGATFTGKKAMWAPSFAGVADAVMDNNVTFNLTSASNPWTIANVGDNIMIAGAGAAGAAVITTITGAVGVPGTVQVAVKNVSGAPIAAKQAYWYDPLVGVTSGPTYGYAWYDPETGHCSNISPLYQVPTPTAIGTFESFANLTPQFQIDPGSIAYPDQTTDGVRFSHILFFRTISTPGASTLYPIGSLNPFVGKVHPGSASTRGSWNPGLYHGWLGAPNEYTAAPPVVAASNYWYDFSSDGDLLLSGGFRAPQETNGKPMVLLRGGATQAAYPYALEYWDRRTWIIPTQDPHAILFSCDEAQCPLGVPEESYPPTNRLQIPSTDGRGIALRRVGDMLLLTTERFAYYVAGNNESNYRLMKISASMPGVGYYQMDEFPTLTGAEGEASTLFYLGRDGTIYQWTLGSAPIPISYQFGSFLPATGAAQLITYQLSRVHCVSAWGRHLVVVAFFSPAAHPAGQGIPTSIYDIDNKVWSTSFRHATTGGTDPVAGVAPMTTVYGLDVPVNELYSITDLIQNAVVVGSWLRDDSATAYEPFYLFTFPLNFDGKKTRKQLVSVNIHATAGLWDCVVVVDESQPQSYNTTFGAYPDPLYSIYGPAPVAPEDGIGTQDLVVMAAQFAGDKPLVGYRFTIGVQKFADTNPAKLFAIDIGYIDFEEQAEGDP